MTDLSTTYLGLELKNPLVASASPLSKKVKDAKKGPGLTVVCLKSTVPSGLTTNPMDGASTTENPSC